MKIDYKIVAEALSYYEKLGYSYIDVPWVVSIESLSITSPLNLTTDSIVKTNPGFFVASGEQSFLQMIIDKELKKGKYCCATPCFRPNDDLKDGLHFQTFFKVELIEYFGFTRPCSLGVCKKVDEMVAHAKRFMEDVIGDELLVETTIDEERLDCSSVLCCDIVTHKTNIELGSYGLRFSEKVGFWIYGTGVALPRLSIAGEDVWQT